MSYFETRLTDAGAVEPGALVTNYYPTPRWSEVEVLVLTQEHGCWTTSDQISKDAAIRHCVLEIKRWTEYLYNLTQHGTPFDMEEEV